MLLSESTPIDWPDSPELADRAAAWAAAYIHIPFCSRLCPYCDFAVVTGREGDFDRYLVALGAEIDSEPAWKPLAPSSLAARNGARFRVLDDRSVRVEPSGPNDVYTIEAPSPSGRLTALRLEALPDGALPGKGPGNAGGNFVVTRVVASVVPPASARPKGRYVRVELPGRQKYLSLAEVQVFDDAENVARARGLATLFCLSTQAVTYFEQKGGFKVGTPDDLPPARREKYELNGRRSKVLVKSLV